jgi:hypothetical protein
VHSQTWAALAADMFAAGFQDDSLAPMLGTARYTEAGGANVWTHELLRLWLPDTLAALPEGTSFRVALRSSRRVNEREGVPRSRTLASRPTTCTNSPAETSPGETRTC